ncbi:MAG: heavy-metal-associated domain-containing protein [Sphingobacteriaceae bacterium]|jgi:copper chaperone
MSIYKYKTTMSCSGCVNKVEKFLNEEKRISKWSVDLNSADKILTIETTVLTPEMIPPLLLKAGYKASLIN